MKGKIVVMCVLVIACSAKERTSDTDDAATGGSAGIPGSAGAGGDASSAGTAGAAGAAGASDHAVPCVDPDRSPNWEILSCGTGQPYLCAYFTVSGTVHCVQCHTNADCPGETPTCSKGFACV